MKSVSIFSFLLISSIAAFAQQFYDVRSIPRDLLSHASAVVRNQETEIEVQELGSTIVHFKTAITILNKNGDRMANLNIYHDKSRIIKNIKGTIYNELGSQLGKFSESDFEDESTWDGFSLFSDLRKKHYHPAVTIYPYTIVYEYELRLKQTLALPDWDPIPNYGISVEKSSFTFTCKPDFKIRYKETNLSQSVNITKGTGGNNVYKWVISNIPAIKYEPLSPHYSKYMTNVEIVPEKFSFYGIEGEMKSWNDLGKWEYQKLVSDRQQLPPETIQYIKDLTKDIPEPKLKAKKIYEYMQSKTHYISVQVGVGGWQPFLAADVDKQNYGDCKALVNYTQALLKAVNIESYYCDVEAGREYKLGMPENFPEMFGNHIILCLPFKNDTTWADCTSQTIPFGYLGDFTDDRTVLACTPEGGKLLRTPKYKTEQNNESRTAVFAIDEVGVLSGTMTSVFKGTKYEDRDYVVNEPQKEQYKMIQKTYPINNMEIDNFNISQDKSFDPSTTEKIKLHARDYASLTDGKYYFMLNPANRETDVPKQVMNRLTDVYINRGSTETDEIIYTIPAGYHSDKIPLNVLVDKPFGKFTATMELNGNKLVYKRKLQVFDGTYSKDTYSDVVDFYQTIVDADDYTVTLVKN